METDKIRNVLNIIFMVLAVAAVVVYFTVDDFTVFLYTCGAAIFFKVVEFFIRFANR